MKLGFAAAEQGREQFLEVIVDHAECRQQALAAFPVQAADGNAQLADRLGQVIAFGRQLSAASFDFLQLVIGPQVDRAQPLAVGLHGVQCIFDFRCIR